MPTPRKNYPRHSQLPTWSDLQALTAPDRVKCSCVRTMVATAPDPIKQSPPAVARLPLQVNSRTTLSMTLPKRAFSPRAREGRPRPSQAHPTRQMHLVNLLQVMVLDVAYDAKLHQLTSVIPPRRRPPRCSTKVLYRAVTPPHLRKLRNTHSMASRSALPPSTLRFHQVTVCQVYRRLGIINPRVGQKTTLPQYQWEHRVLVEAEVILQQGTILDSVSASHLPILKASRDSPAKPRPFHLDLKISWRRHPMNMTSMLSLTRHLQ